MRIPWCLMLWLLFSTAPSLNAQQAITLREAIADALRGGPRLAVARADSAAARALVATARAFPNPALSLGYTKDIPRYHVELDQPVVYPWVRKARIRSAEATATAAVSTLAAERATVRHDVQAAYIRAAAAEAVARLARRNAQDAERLLESVRARFEAGDAAELDVRLAAITAGQLANAALTDSALAVDALLSLQYLIGFSASQVEIVLADSLQSLPFPQPAPAPPLRVAAARFTLASTQAQLVFQRWTRFPVVILRAGFDWGDPTGAEPGLLPVVGVAFPLPLWNRNRGEVALAMANAARAAAQLALTERATAAAIATGERNRLLARDRLRRDRAIIQDAQRVAEMAIVAYREGAYPLASVLEAQRTARDALRQFIDDLAASLTAEAAYALAVTAGAIP